jgi:hypothetical protein
MTKHPSPTVTIICVLALLIAPRLGAQILAPSGLPEPRLRETPWGDFPLERLVRGARLRLTSADGRREEQLLLALGDSAVDLQTPSGDAMTHVTFTALRSYRRIEVRALPAWSDRVGPASVAAGALLGAVTGSIIHSSRKPSSAAVHRRSRLDDMTGVATIGGLVGWEIGIHTLGMPRWRPVTMP